MLETVPEFLHLCFSEAVKVASEDSQFNVLTPDSIALGLRIVFDTSGDCVDVYPGAPEDPPQGIWTFDWLVHAQADNSEGSGAIHFQLGGLDDDGGMSTGILVAIIAGAALILVAGGGVAVSRWRAHS